MSLRWLFPLLLLSSLTPVASYAQSANTGQDSVLARADTLVLPTGFDGAAPPQLPSTISRDENGRITVRAVRLTQPLRLDGALDEDYYRTLQPMSDFIQAEPLPGRPATERTEVWVFYDNTNVYVSMRALESNPDNLIANELRRDSFNILQNDNMFFGFDTFYDKRNSFGFQFNPLGGRMDGQISNESQYSGDFNPVWRVYTKRTPEGWTAEARVPFKSLRFRPGQAQIWGFQARRINRSKNETSFLAPVPAGLGTGGMQRVSQYATLVGLEVPAGSRALDIKPYVTSNVASDLTSSRPFSNRFGKDWGIDTKYAVTQNLTADFTYNTDFAQVEADDQQVNLTRFSLFFPEKRDFFLENSGNFIFANTGGGQQGDTPTIFYSRRIGLDGGSPIPLDVGGRLSGRIGRYSLGALSIRTGELGSVRPNTFNTLRLRRDILRRSAVGVLYTGRARAANGLGEAETFGVDSTLNFYQNLSVNTYWAKTSTPTLVGKDTSYRGQFNYNGDRYGAQAEWLNIGDNFNPEIGFVRRDNFTKRRAQLRFSPRTRQRFRAVRKFTYQASIESFVNSFGQTESKELRGEFSADMQNSDGWEVIYEQVYELLIRPFNVARGVTLPIGGYDVSRFRASYSLGQQRPIAGTGFFERGPFYGGERNAFGFTGGRVRLTSRVAVEPAVQINQVTTPSGDFTTKLVSTRTTVALTPLAFVTGLVQYNSSNNTFSSNVRLRWEYEPGSEVFLVYNEGRDTSPTGFPTLQNRSIVFKINKLFRY
jgi:Domain of unknown function (DUF5916)